MINRKELESSITRPDVKARVQNKESLIIQYKANGQDDQKLKNKFRDGIVCAVSIKNGTKEIFKVKTNRGGHLYDPGKESFTYRLDAKDRLTNEPMFQFREVPERSFDRYVSYLKTRHNSHLIVAEREIS